MGTTASKEEKNKLPSLRSQLIQKGKQVMADHSSISRHSSLRKSIQTTSSEENISIISKESKKNSFELSSDALDDKPWKEPKRPFSTYKQDDKEYERQLRQHYVLKHIFGGNIQVPVPQDKTIIILDSVCGAGFWTLDMALEYPNANIIGLEAFHERSETKNLMIGAPNIVYKLGDLASHLQLPANSVDIIYQRDASLVVSQGSWPAVLTELKRVAKPGAYIQLVEYNYILGDPGPVLTLVNEWYENAAKAFGIDPEEVKKLKKYLVEAGFQEVKEKIVQIPIGEWHKDKAEKEKGFLCKQIVKAFFNSKRAWWVSELNMSGPEYDKVTNAALKEFDKQRSYMEWAIYTARKPL